MGKRNKEPQVGRRRPMIQLSGSSQKSGMFYELCTGMYTKKICN